MTFALEINLPLLIKMFGIILIISIYCSFIMNTTVIISLGINLFTFFALCSLYDFEIGLFRHCCFFALKTAQLVKAALSIFYFFLNPSFRETLLLNTSLPSALSLLSTQK